MWPRDYSNEIIASLDGVLFVLVSLKWKKYARGFCFSLALDKRINFENLWLMYQVVHIFYNFLSDRARLFLFWALPVNQNCTGMHPGLTDLTKYTRNTLQHHTSIACFKSGLSNVSVSNLKSFFFLLIQQSLFLKKDRFKVGTSVPPVFLKKFWLFIDH